MDYTVCCILQWYMWTTVPRTAPNTYPPQSVIQEKTLLLVLYHQRISSASRKAHRLPCRVYVGCRVTANTNTAVVSCTLYVLSILQSSCCTSNFLSTSLISRCKSKVLRTARSRPQLAGHQCLAIKKFRYEQLDTSP